MTLEPNKDLRPGDTVTITCSSYQGYPKAEVLWQDGQGAPLTGNVTTSQMANEQGLFDVHSVLRVVLGANGTYSCLVRNPVLQQDAHGSVTITPHRNPAGFSFVFLNVPWVGDRGGELVQSPVIIVSESSSLPSVSQNSETPNNNNRNRLHRGKAYCGRSR